MFATWISVDDLQFGMHVVRLDRPWMGSGLPTQGFRIVTDKQVQRLREICTKVYVTNASSLRGDESSASVIAACAPSVRAEWEDGASEERRAVLARAIRGAARPFNAMRLHLNHVLADVRAGRTADVDDAIDIVGEMIGHLTSDVDPWLWLTELRSEQDSLAQHCANVAVLSVAFGLHLGLPHAQLATIGLAALFHDVGKTHASHLLHKNGPLESDERDEIRRRAADGCDIINATCTLPDASLELMRLHHQRRTGDGYGHNVRDDADLDKFLRVLSICDVYDALRSDRSYRNAMPPDLALQAMRRMAADTLDDELVHEFVRFIGVYPVGCGVELATGDRGIVMSRHAHYKLKPVVMLARDRSGRNYEPRPCVCLAEREQRGDGRHWQIVRLAAPLAAGIDTAQIAMECLRDNGRLPHPSPHPGNTIGASLVERASLTASIPQ